MKRSSVMLIPFALVLGLVAGTPLAAQSSGAVAAGPGMAGLQFLGVSVRDLDASEAWYARSFGMRRAADLPCPDGTCHTRLLESDHLLIELSRHDNARSVTEYAGRQVPTFLVHGFFKGGLFVTNLDSAIAMLRDRGVTTLGQVGADTTRHTRWVLLRDNSGNFLQLLEKSR